MITVLLRVMGVRLGVWACISWLAVSSPVVATEPNKLEPSASKAFAPGVRIDWVKRRVEVSAKVVLRKGPLELLACSPHTREHESILSVASQPTHIYQAMGLVGLVPGAPPRYAEKTDTLTLPTGQALSIGIRYSLGGKVRLIPAEKWMLEIKRSKPSTRIHWVFSGSGTESTGQLGAQEEGTIVCVVDFETALISVGSSHSADNESLWLEANETIIPPIGTPCTLVIFSAEKPTVWVAITKDGKLLYEGRRIAAGDITKRVRDAGKRGQFPYVVLEVADGVSARTLADVEETLVAAGVDRSEMDYQSGRVAKPMPTIRSPGG